MILDLDSDFTIMVNAHTSSVVSHLYLQEKSGPEDKSDHQEGERDLEHIDFLAGRT